MLDLFSFLILFAKILLLVSDELYCESTLCTNFRYKDFEEAEDLDLTTLTFPPRAPQGRIILFGYCPSEGLVYNLFTFIKQECIAVQAWLYAGFNHVASNLWLGGKGNNFNFIDIL